ncbi:hypothetical protein Naga_100006g93 [Nannochloropsis gaditana]|uniref:Uncharacterized protein n=1 Tax=Nannochloropsis gaditana TaxID=72520 RepID=W7TQT7_9STRA|nr:hypothetical protein Naga_100006g93 [Nannochloropsis gaditana]
MVTTSLCAESSDFLQQQQFPGPTSIDTQQPLEKHVLSVTEVHETTGSPSTETTDNQHGRQKLQQGIRTEQMPHQPYLLQPLPVLSPPPSAEDKNQFAPSAMPPQLALFSQPTSSLTLALETADPPVLEGFYNYPKSQEGVHHEPWIRLFGAILQPAADGFVVTDHTCTRGVSLWTFTLRLLGVKALGWRALDESATWKSIGIRVTKLRKQQEEGSAKININEWIGEHIVWRREFRTRPFDMRVPRPPPPRTTEEAAAELPGPVRVKSTFALGITLRDPSDPDVQRALANAVDRIAPGAVPSRMGLVFAEYRRLWNAYEPLSLQQRQHGRVGQTAGKKRKKMDSEAASAALEPPAVAPSASDDSAMGEGQEKGQVQLVLEGQGEGHDQVFNSAEREAKDYGMMVMQAVGGDESHVHMLNGGMGMAAMEGGEGGRGGGMTGPGSSGGAVMLAPADTASLPYMAHQENEIQPPIAREGRVEYPRVHGGAAGVGGGGMGLATGLPGQRGHVQGEDVHGERLPVEVGSLHLVAPQNPPFSHGGDHVRREDLSPSASREAGPQPEFFLQHGPTDRQDVHLVGGGEESGEYGVYHVEGPDAEDGGGMASLASMAMEAGVPVDLEHHHPQEHSHHAGVVHEASFREEGLVEDQPQGAHDHEMPLHQDANGDGGGGAYPDQESASLPDPRKLVTL